MVNNFLVIDAHCHIYPDKIAPHAVKSTGDFYGLPNSFDGRAQTLLSEGERAGVDKFVVQSVATTPSQVSSINKFIAKEVSEKGDKFIGLGTLHPNSENQKRDIEEIISLGLHGVKLHPDIQNFKIDDYRCLKIYELCESEGLPILMHTGDHRFDLSNPNRMLPIIETYEKLNVVGAHLGGWSVWDDAVKMLSGHKNFFVDTSSSFKFMPPEKAKEIIEAFGIEQVLFATDYPMWNIKDEIDYLLNLDLSDDSLRKILSENALKVYNR